MSAAHSDADPPQMIDWDLAVATANRMMRTGPEVSREEAEQVVGDLRQGAADSTAHVRDYTGLVAETATAPVVVVDRPGWVQANADGFRHVLSPLIVKMAEKRPEQHALMTAIGSRVTGVEAGTLLAFLSGKVLGQFDPFWGSGDGAGTTGADGAHTGDVGRMLLVAPNIVQVERELDVDVADFRLWVCLHEETHRVQFTAVPWLRAHVRQEIGTLVEATPLDPATIAGMLRDGFERVGKALRGEGEASLLDLVQTPEQKAVLDRLTAIMSLLEGHADVVMDGVGPAVIPTVAHIRERFQERRQGGSPLDQLLRKLLGLDAKMRQYREGATFVRGVLDRVGMPGFNAVWTGPETLPTKDEITDPAAWVRRVHG
jgi:coenzyme F420 biosynthesis associated uncharacterized protein